MRPAKLWYQDLWWVTYAEIIAGPRIWFLSENANSIDSVVAKRLDQMLDTLCFTGVGVLQAAWLEMSLSALALARSRSATSSRIEKSYNASRGVQTEKTR